MTGDTLLPDAWGLSTLILDAQLACLWFRADPARSLEDSNRCAVRICSKTLVVDAAFSSDAGLRRDGVAGDYCLWAPRYDPCHV